MTDEVPYNVVEAHCPLCSCVASDDRKSLRATLNSIPLDEHVCIACEIAFWRNLGFPVNDIDEYSSTSKH
jgi:hypothetical protein